jgi:hypothetical protein
MRVDVGIWTKKRVTAFNPKAKHKVEEIKLESHWLRFEKYMGDSKGFGLSYTDGKFLLTDIDFIMYGNTFFKQERAPESFDFRAV